MTTAIRSRAVRRSSKRRPNPFFDGIISAMTLAPVTKYPSTRYLKHRRCKLQTIPLISSKDPWMEIGCSMRSIGEQKLNDLEVSDREKLEKLLYERR